jgi:protein SCO1/2
MYFLRSPRWFAPLFVLLALAFGCARVDAAGVLHGQVIGSSGADTILVRHGAYDGMPAMTMSFQIPPGQTVAVGDEITAQVDRTKEPWLLSHIHIRHGATHQALQAVHELAAGDSLPDVRFFDQQNKAFSLSSLHGQRYAISLIYTRCQDAAMCPLISAKYRKVQDASSSTDQLVEVTLDPAFDTPSVLAKYAHAFGANAKAWHLLTGKPADIFAFNQSLGVATQFQSNGILHTERLVIVNADGRIDRFVDDPSWSVADLTAILAQSDSPWRRFMLASTHAFTVCGEKLGPGGRLAVHHTALGLIPIGLIGVVLLVFRRLGLLGAVG